MGAVYQCCKCGAKIVSSIRKYQGKFYCEHGYEQVMEEAQRFEEEKQKLILFIKDLFSLNECPDVVLYAIDRAIKDGKKLSGIKGTLRYYYDYLGNPADNVNIIGTVIQREYANAAKEQENRKVEGTRNVKFLVPLLMAIRNDFVLLIEFHYNDYCSIK